MRHALVPVLVLGLVGHAGAQAPPRQAAAPGVPVRIWPGAAPHAPAAPARETVKTAEHVVAGRPWTYIENVSVPMLTVYRPATPGSGVAVIVFPGGGYQLLAIDLEGTEVCDWLVANGIACAVLKYRVPNRGRAWSQQCGCEPATGSSRPLEDAQRALRWLRYHAAEYGIDPERIGVLGFSAGGHLVAAISNQYAQRLYAPVDSADTMSARPDFAIALYPGHLYDPRRRTLNARIHVTPAAPPTLLVQAENDDVDDVRNSLVYYDALRSAGVRADLHIFAEGGHAFGLRRTSAAITAWPTLVLPWLRARGLLEH